MSSLKKSKLIIPKHKLKVLYQEKKLPVSEIAKRFKIHVSTIFRQLQKCNIPADRKNPIPRELLITLYLRKKLEINEIAKRLECSKAKVLYWVNKYNLPKRVPKYELKRSLLEELYLRKKLSIRQIGTKLKIPRSSIHYYLLKYGIQLRRKGHILQYPRKPFLGDLKERAYMLGLRAGDIYARRKGGVRVQVSTTHLSQALMFKNVFGKYGHFLCYIINHSLSESKKEIKAECYMDNSFGFLLNRPANVPEEVLKKEDTFFSFLAGFMDCEGFWTIAKANKNNVRLVFGITNTNKELLLQLKNKLERLGFKTHLRLITKVGAVRPLGRVKKNVYTLELCRKVEIVTLINKLLPLSHHEEKIQKMKLLLKFKDRKWKEVKEALLNFRRMVKKQHIDNLENDFILRKLGDQNKRDNK